MSEGTGPEAVPSWLGERPPLGTPEHREWAFRAMRAVFPPEQIGVRPVGRENVAFVGHAATTDRLLAVDPMWNWEPYADDERGLPALVFVGQQPVGLWIRLTVAGISRIGYGSVDAGTKEAVKELIGDAIRNAAMRYGVALDLWSREDLITDRLRRGEVEVPDGVDPADVKPGRRRRKSSPDPVKDPPLLEESLRQVDALARSKGVPREDFTARWRTANGKPIEKATPAEAAAFVEGAVKYMREHGEFVPEDAL